MPESRSLGPIVDRFHTSLGAIQGVEVSEVSVRTSPADVPDNTFFELTSGFIPLLPEVLYVPLSFHPMSGGKQMMKETIHTSDTRILLRRGDISEWYRKGREIARYLRTQLPVET